MILAIQVRSSPLRSRVNRRITSWSNRSPVCGSRGDLLVPSTVLAEVGYFLDRFGNALAEASFVESVAAGDFVLTELDSDDVSRMAALTRQYADMRLGTTDASVIALSERLGVIEIATFDRRHFAAVRPRHVVIQRLSALVRAVTLFAGCADRVQSGRVATGVSGSQQDRGSARMHAREDGIDSSDASGPNAAGAPAAAPSLEQMLQSFADFAETQGGSRPLSINYVTAARSTVASVLFDGDTDPSFTADMAGLPALVMVASGDFVGNSAKIPPGAAPPRGSEIFEVVDPADGGVMGWGINDVATDISSLGAVHTISL